MSDDPARGERQPRQLCPKCHQPVAPNARYCANCGSAIGPDHSNIWPIVLASVVALLVGAAIAFAIGGTGGSTKPGSTDPLGRERSKLAVGPLMWSLRARRRLCLVRVRVRRFRGAIWGFGAHG